MSLTFKMVAAALEIFAFIGFPLVLAYVALGMAAMSMTPSSFQSLMDTNEIVAFMRAYSQIFSQVVVIWVVSVLLLASRGVDYVERLDWTMSNGLTGRP